MEAFLRTTTLSLLLALAAAPFLLSAQSTIPNSYPVSSSASAPAPKAAATATKSKKGKKKEVAMKPFSRLAIGGGISLEGGNAQLATNVNRYLNLRASGNYFSYSINNISTNGFNIDGKVNFATGGLSMDLYPFPTHGFRLSPGVQFYNQNRITATSVVTSGQSFKLNGTDYYSDNTNAVTGSTPISMTGRLGLNTNKTAFTMTTGWGNVINRKGGHWSFPLELGAAFVGAPSVNVALSGWACTDSALTECANLASSSTAISQQVQTNLSAQVAKWKSDLDPLKAYPILSFGVAYNFAFRK
jgi:hypothetical protein